MKYLVLLLVSESNVLVSAQDNPETLVSQGVQALIDQNTSIPTSPRAADFGRFENIPINYFKDSTSISNPNHSLGVGGLSVNFISKYETT
jgi:hypothetical protein